jgi:hypothetical protein
MTASRLVLCTDLDRTVIPNGTAPEHPEARACFNRFCHLPDVKLVYVSGRHLNLVEDAIYTWKLPLPDYVITDVGTRIYQLAEGQTRELEAWPQQIDQDWRGHSHDDLKMMLQNVPGLQLQEDSKQNRHKLSFYLPLGCDSAAVIAEMQQRLQQAEVAASIVWSVDDLEHTGLIDVLPRQANKLQAILFLQQLLGCSDDEMLFAGDSGNDLVVLASNLPTVLVQNASDEVRQAARDAVQAGGHPQTLYLAQGDSPFGMDGNYSAGVLEGVWHFAPQLRELLEHVVANGNAGGQGGRHG